MLQIKYLLCLVYSEYRYTSVTSAKCKFSMTYALVLLYDPAIYCAILALVAGSQFVCCFWKWVLKAKDRSQVPSMYYPIIGFAILCVPTLKSSPPNTNSVITFAWMMVTHLFGRIFFFQDTTVQLFTNSNFCFCLRAYVFPLQYFSYTLYVLFVWHWLIRLHTK